jgi:phosphotransferase system  glucose/maltose/N-acetylglucosamine-specific IIC component
MMQQRWLLTRCWMMTWTTVLTSVAHGLQQVVGLCSNSSRSTDLASMLIGSLIRVSTSAGLHNMTLKMQQQRQKQLIQE